MWPNWWPVLELKFYIGLEPTLMANFVLFFHCKIFPFSRLFNLKNWKRGALEPWCYTTLLFWKMFTNFLSTKQVNENLKNWYNVLILTALFQKKTLTNHSSDKVLWIVQVFLKQTLRKRYRKFKMSRQLMYNLFKLQRYNWNATS